MYDRHPQDLSVKEYALVAYTHYKEMGEEYNKALKAGASHEDAKRSAAAAASKAFMDRLPESTDIQKAWHNEHIDHVNNFLQHFPGNNIVKEDAPTMSMAGGGIASRDILLGGSKTYLIKRQILSTVLGKVRAKQRTKAT